MSSEQALKIVVEYNKLPETEEKQEIDRQYLNDEINSFEFFCLAEKYLQKSKHVSETQDD